MHVFDHLNVDYAPDRREREEAGRFVPVTQVQTVADLRGVLGDISALLHLQDSPETLAAVRYCISELLRNAIEHSGSDGGAFVCAHNFDEGTPPRVTVAVADCGIGIRKHLSRAHADAAENDEAAIRMALQPGVTGALAGMYGAPDNAGAGLFITRSIAKGTGGYFLIVSGKSAYRLRRAKDEAEQTELPLDPTVDRHDMWSFGHAWRGTVVTLEIRTDMIADFDNYFAWIRRMVPEREEVTQRIQFT
jgi:signal transduction histidine kinase